MSGLSVSFRHALRQFWLSPVFSVAAVLTLSLGIGGTTARSRTRREGAPLPVDWPRSQSGRLERRRIATRRSRFIERTLAGIARVSHDTIFAEQWARRDGMLQRRLTEDQFDTALEAIADFTDLRSPSRAGHSRAVAKLAIATNEYPKIDLREKQVTNSLITPIAGSTMM